jgi:hypothetical protein
VGVEEIRILVRAYAALTLARHAAERHAGCGPPHPCLSAVINSQRLALGELESLLEAAVSGVTDPSPMREPEAECAAMLM